MKLRFGSVCSGIEAASVAWNPLGWEAAWFSEIEPFPCAVLAHHYPDVPNIGDMTKLPELILSGEVEAPDMLCGGTPCFAAGHMVLTVTGYKPIEQVCVGDFVMTHKGRLREVLRIGSKTAQVGKLSMVGHKGIVCTPNHKFLSCKWESKPVGKDDKYRRVETVSDADWVEAKNLPGMQWFSLKNYEHQETAFESAKFSEVEEKQLLIAGMYVGDGYIRRYTGKSKKNVMLCLNEKKLEFFNEHFSGCRAYISKERTAYKVAISDTKLADWLVENFGEHSGKKRIPSWLLSHPKREAFLLGYIKTDGFTKGNLTQFSTVSKALAYGICDLANSLDYACAVAEIKVLPKKVIEGRLVNQSNWWQIRAYKNSRKSRALHGFLSRSVTSYDEYDEHQVVYNIEVQEDNSYIVEGAVVHNCQAFSIAGQRCSLDDERGNLSLVFCEVANAIDAIRFVQRKQPSIIFWENVPGVLNTKDNAFGCLLGELVGADAPLLSRTGNKWPSAGYVAGPKRKAAWRVLDAQFFGVPQRRRRVFVVASARDGFNPAKVLFERNSVSGNIGPSRTSWKNFAAGIRDRFD